MKKTRAPLAARSTSMAAAFETLLAEPGALLARYPARSFERGEALIECAAGSPATVPEPALAYVVEGLVCGVRHDGRSPLGTATTVLAAGEGGWLGFEALEFGVNLLRYVARTPTVASVIPLSALRRETTSDPLLLHLLRDLGRQWWAVASATSRACDPLRRRTLRLLGALRGLRPHPTIELRQQDLADLLGVRRQTLQPVLKGLERDGLLTLGYGEVTVARAEALLEALAARGVAALGAAPAPRGGRA